MHTIEPHVILPLTDQLLLISFDDVTADLRDVKLLVNRFPELKPKTEYDLFCKSILTDPQYMDTWKAEIDHAEPPPDESAPEITLSLPDDLLAESLELCAELEVPFDRFVRAILQFHISTDAQGILSDVQEMLPRHSLNPDGIRDL